MTIRFQGAGQHRRGCNSTTRYPPGGRKLVKAMVSQARMLLGCASLLTGQEAIRFGVRHGPEEIRWNFFRHVSTEHALGGWFSDRIGGTRVLTTVFAALVILALLLTSTNLVLFTIGALGEFFPPIVPGIVRESIGGYAFGFILLSLSAIAALVATVIFVRSRGTPREVTVAQRV